MRLPLRDLWFGFLSQTTRPHTRLPQAVISTAPWPVWSIQRPVTSAGRSGALRGGDAGEQGSARDRAQCEPGRVSEIKTIHARGSSVVGLGCGLGARCNRDAEKMRQRRERSTEWSPEFGLLNFRTRISGSENRSLYNGHEPAGGDCGARAAAIGWPMPPVLPARSSAGRRAEPRKARTAMSLTLAFRNLFHDRVRLAVTLIGILFSIVLVAVQLGLYLGARGMIISMIDRADGDLWIMAYGTKNFEEAQPIRARERYVALATPDVVERRSSGHRVHGLAQADRRLDAGGGDRRRCRGRRARAPGTWSRATCRGSACAMR